MIPDSHIVEKSIEIIAGSLSSTLGIRAIAPIFRIGGGFIWEMMMDRVKENTYEFAKDKVGLKVRNDLHHLSVTAFGKELAIHHPNRDRTHETYTLFSHYLHPERFSPLLQETIAAEMISVGGIIAKDMMALPRQHIPRTLGVEVYG